jgi:hypothetical protein
VNMRMGLVRMPVLRVPVGHAATLPGDTVGSHASETL